MAISSTFGATRRSRHPTITASPPYSATAAPVCPDGKLDVGGATSSCGTAGRSRSITSAVNRKMLACRITAVISMTASAHRPEVQPQQQREDQQQPHDGRRVGQPADHVGRRGPVRGPALGEVAVDLVLAGDHRPQRVGEQQPARDQDQVHAAGPAATTRRRTCRPAARAGRLGRPAAPITRLARRASSGSTPVERVVRRPAHVTPPGLERRGGGGDQRAGDQPGGDHVAEVVHAETDAVEPGQRDHEQPRQPGREPGPARRAAPAAARAPARGHRPRC